MNFRQAHDHPEQHRAMNLAIVVQRYGADISGGAELHARYIAERLSHHASVRVLTTCARDYVTWRNELPAGDDEVNGVRVERFPVVHERDTLEFGKRSTFVFTRQHSLHDELRWLDSEGPASPGLLKRLRTSGHEFDYVLFFSMRYHHAYHGARLVSQRAVLVPTAERDAALGLAIFQPLLRGVRAIMYNSFEERALLNAVSANQHVPGVVVGIGSQIPPSVDAQRAKQKFGLNDPFIVYVGRIDSNKGCAELFDFFRHFLESSNQAVDLVLIGTPILRIPAHPRIRHLGYVNDADKYDVLAGAEMLIMPSYYESLSMVALEAWALGKPVIVNAKCDVLLGQCLRSDAGLYYADALEFGGAVGAILGDRSLAGALGRNGREYFLRHYSWPVIERKYLEMFARLASERPAEMETLPGWWARRKRSLPPAARVLDHLPSGPVVSRRMTTGATA
jgi:glycosyltransferase involved in cell wall biosynthesis